VAGVSNRKQNLFTLKKIIMITLTATKEKALFGAFAGYATTTIKDEKGNIKAIYPPEVKQPRRGQKKIIINCFTYLLKWI
jgi:hypothetical protein